MPNSDPAANKLDARLAAVVRLPSDTVKRMIELDEPPPDPYAGTRLAGSMGTIPLARVLEGVRVDAAGEILVSVLIRCQGSPANLKGEGVEVRRAIGRIVVAEVSRAALSRLEQDPQVVFMELVQPLAPHLDQSVRVIEADRMHAASPPSRGAGVFVGVVDLDGIDFHHPDFCSAEGTRIDHLWHHGKAYDSAEINRDLEAPEPYSVVPQPTGKHGTHVASIAAGNGRALQGRYTGVAPEARLLFATVSSTGELITALQDMFDRAGSVPCVVNLSLGTRDGPRDGTSNMEVAIDDLVATPGRAVVVSAGNDGNSKAIKVGRIEDGEMRLDLDVRAAETNAGEVEIWYPGAERLEVLITDPHGIRRGPVRPGEPCSSLELGRALITLSSTTSEGGNGQIVVMFQPLRRHAPIDPGTWRITLRRVADRTQPAVEGEYHATLTHCTQLAWSDPTRRRSSLSSPSTAKGAICVGCCDRRGAISEMSSRGPTRDGRFKPDFVAPGELIHAAKAYSRDYLPMCGTSMAAPHVAGLVALLFERRGVIPVEEVRAELRPHADRKGLEARASRASDLHPGVAHERSWDPAFGWGRVRAPIERDRA